MVAAVAGVIRRRRYSRLSAVPAPAADAAAAVAATVAHRIVAADVRRGTVAAAAIYKRNDT